jgi:hypothetical protein
MLASLLLITGMGQSAIAAPLPPNTSPAASSPAASSQVASDQVVLIAQNTAAATDAEGIFRDAYEKRYTWDDQFPGYQAEVSVRWGEAVDQGLVFVGPNGSVEIKNIEDDDTRQLIQQQLQMEIIHRQDRPFADAHRDRSFDLADTNEPGAVIVQEIGDPQQSSYKIKNHKIAQVHRVMGDVSVLVNTLGWISPPEGYLPSHFQVEFRDVSTDELLEQDDVRDFHEKIGSYYLLTRREIRTSSALLPPEQPLADIWIRFNDIQPLSAA